MRGLSEEACRSIFFDWALGLPDETNARDAIRELLKLYAEIEDQHPMKMLLREGLERIPVQRMRRGCTLRRRRPETVPDDDKTVA